MNDETKQPNMPPEVRAIAERGYATWIGPDVEVSDGFRALFDERRIPVSGVRQVRVWGLQVDDERALPGRERTRIPDEEIWEINLEAKDGSHYEVESRFLKPAPE